MHWESWAGAELFTVTVLSFYKLLSSGPITFLYLSHINHFCTHPLPHTKSTWKRTEKDYRFITSKVLFLCTFRTLLSYALRRKDIYIYKNSLFLLLIVKNFLLSTILSPRTLEMFTSNTFISIKLQVTKKVNAVKIFYIGIKFTLLGCWSHLII